MRKSLSLLLSGAMAFGLMVPANAAPLAQMRNASDNLKRCPEATRTQSSGENRALNLTGGVRKISNSGSGLFRVPESLVKVKNAKALRSATTAQRVSASLNLYGTVIYNSTWTNYDKLGVYKLPVSTGGDFTMMFKTQSPVYSFYDGDGKVYTMYEVAYGSYVMGYDLYVYDAETGDLIQVYEWDDLPLKATDVAYDTTSGRVYGCFSGDYYGEVYRHWGYLDLQSKKVMKIADIDVSLRGVAIDKFGQAYGIDLSGNLYKINKTTGELTLVGATGCPDLFYMSSAAYNDKDNTIILAYCNDAASGLTEINPQTAQSTVIAEFANGDEVVGMYIPFQAPDKAPAVPGFEVSCSDGSMDANFTITLPTELYDGTDVSDTEMGYKIYADGEEILAGTGVAGETIEVVKTMENSGMIQFAAVATNTDGESNQAKYSCYIGKGTPAAPGNVKLAYADGCFTLTWDAVTASSDGGFFNPEEVKYDIVDAEGTTVAADITGESWTKTQATPDDFTGFSFGVMAKYDAKTSKSVMSNIVYLGHYNAPLEMNMKDQATFSQHAVIDANDDGKTWKFTSNKGTIYSYSNSNNGDDWLISPAIHLEAGKAYDFAAVAHAYSDRYPEMLEIKMGTSSDAEAMTIMLVEPTTLGGDDYTMTASLVPAATGDYFIGFHAVSEAGQWDLTLCSYSISAPYGATAPDAVTDLKVVPDIKGDLKAAIEFKTPAKTVTGADFTGNMLVRVLRDNELVEEKTVGANTLVSIQDEVAEAGRYTYTVEACTTTGDKGRVVSASSYVGPNVPNPPAVVKAVENPDKNGELTLTWEHATEDVDGNPLYTDNLAYNVYLFDNEAQKWNKMNQQPVTELSYTFQAQPENAPQAFQQVGVLTINRGVEGEYLQGAGLVPVGPAYELPVAMSCLDDVHDYIVGIDPWDGCEFGMKADGDMNSVTSQDGDGQFFYGERTGSSSTLGMGKGRGDFILGKVDLAGAAHPVFSLYTWKITDTDKTKLDIIVVCEGEQSVVTTIDYTNDTDNIWTKKVVDLEAYAGKVIQLIIRYHSDGLVYCFFDNMKFVDMPDYDLGAVSVTAPKKAVAGETFEVEAVVENVGRLAAGAFTVELLGNGEVVASQTVDGLAAGEQTALTFEQALSMAGDKVVAYTARVVYDADLDLSNNLTSQAATVTREESLLPSVQNLAGESGEEGNVLTWDAILHDELPYDPYLESFEDAEPFSNEAEGWTFIDRDDRPSGNLGNIEVPNHEGGVDHQSFIVIDGTHENFSTSSYAKEYVAASGNQYIGSIYSIGDGPTDIVPSDDWAISPELKGIAQTVTFKGKNCSINYSELIQVWYCTENSVNPDDFVQLDSFNNPGMSCRVVRTDGWGDFSFDLPEGALRFAIRVVSNDGMMFMLDDVEFIAANATIGLELTGYNVYCDGVKLNTEPVTANTFTHADADMSADHVYHVTAVYNRGESEAASVTVKKSGLADIVAAGVKVSVEGKRIIVTGAEGMAVAIVATDGKTLYSAEGNASVDMLSGIYLVRVNRTTTKVVVR